MLIPMQAGGESLTRVELLIGLTKYQGNTADALKSHFVNGWTVELVASMYDLQRPNVVRAINRLNEVNAIVESIKELDLYHLSDNSEKKGVTHAPC